MLLFYRVPKTIYTSIFIRRLSVTTGADGHNSSCLMCRSKPIAWKILFDLATHKGMGFDCVMFHSNESVGQDRHEAAAEPGQHFLTQNMSLKIKYSLANSLSKRSSGWQAFFQLTWLFVLALCSCLCCRKKKQMKHLTRGGMLSLPPSLHSRQRQP